MTLDIAIVGGGIAGLSLATALAQTDREVAIFDARDYFGGRICAFSSNEAEQISFDLGPSWVWPEDQPLLAALLRKHDLPTMEQPCEGANLYQASANAAAQRFVDPSIYAGAYRLRDGLDALVSAMLETLPAARHSKHRLLSLQNRDTHIALEFEVNESAPRTVLAKQVALLLPPRLVAQSLQFDPALSPRILRLMRETPTWMAGHAKVVAHYPTAFWREQGLSGNAFCSYPEATLGEIYDASHSAIKSAALAGFFALSAAQRERLRGELEGRVIAQLTHLFGAPAAEPKRVVIKDWARDTLTATPQDWQIPAAHPVYGNRYLRLAHWEDKLYFGGSETAQRFGGYLEGALQSAQTVYRQMQL